MGRRERDAREIIGQCRVIPPGGYDGYNECVLFAGHSLFDRMPVVHQNAHGLLWVETPWGHEVQLLGAHTHRMRLLEVTRAGWNFQCSRCGFIVYRPRTWLKTTKHPATAGIVRPTFPMVA